MKKSGSVTVFLALVFVCISTLLCALLESARTAGARFYLRNMADSAIDSVFSEYNRKLWDAYRIVLLETRDADTNAKNLENYMRPYAENCNWYAITAPKAEITDSKSVTDGGGVWFEQEVMDYMKYDWITLGCTPESVEQLWKKVTEAKAMDAITKAYGLRSKEAVRMEKAVSKIVKNLQTQNELKSKAHKELLSGDNSAFQRTSSKLENTVNALPSLISDYCEKASAFGTHLDAVQKEHAEDFNKLEPENKEALENQIESYREYTDQDGARRVEIEALDDNNDNTLRTITDVRTLADETEAYIDEAEDDDEDDDIDEGALWREVADAWDQVTIPSFGGASGVRDEEQESLLESIGDLLEDGFLDLVLPDGRKASEGTIDNAEFPSVTSITERTGEDASLLTRAAVDEYAGKYLPNFTDDSKRPVAYELEYVVHGGNSDKDNLTGSLMQILAVREGLNFLHIMMDHAKMSEAKKLAVTIAGSVALPALAGLLQCLIIATWALAESLMDLKALLSGKKISLIKTKDDWMLGLTDILTIAVTRELPSNKIKENSLGVDYETYLKLLLFIKSSEERDYRVMDMIQMNIKREEPGFLMNNCIYGIKAEVSCESKHLFTTPGLSSGNRSGASQRYKLTAEVVKAY